MAQQSESIKLFEQCALPKAALQALTTEAEKTLEVPQVKSDGTFTFDYFMRSQVLIIKHWDMFGVPLREKRTEKRREMYADEDWENKVKDELVAQ